MPSPDPLTLALTLTRCPACRNINFKQRRACHRCNEPKPPPEVLAARKEQEERQQKATERRRQEQIEEEKRLLEEQALTLTLTLSLNP